MPETATLLSQVYLKLDGSDPPADLVGAVLELRVESSLHLPDLATLVLHDPHLKWIDADALTPGKTLTVTARASRGEKPLFDGEIVELEPDFEPGAQRLIVRAFDRLHRLARGQQTRSFQNVTDGDLVRKLAREVGLQAQVGPTSQVYPYVFQNNESNLAFLGRRAAALGYLLYVQGKTLHCEPPNAAGDPIPLEWGATLLAFHPRLTTVGQVSGFTVRGWDPATRREIVGQAQRGSGAPKIGQQKSGGELAQGAFNVDAQCLIADRPIRSQAEADRLAQAAADRQAGRFIEADGACTGNPAIIAGASLQITAVGDRFTGTYFVTATTHVFRGTDSYTTEFTVSALEASTLLSLLAPPAAEHHAGAASGASGSGAGLVIGVVTDNQDPLGQGRVKVKYPWLSADHASDWARVVAPGAGPQRGCEFLPEVNDEVLVGFEHGDVHYPYVLGGLWNGQDAPPESSSSLVSGGKVQKRVIRSRTGHTVTLDDSDGGGGITIVDAKGNKLTFDTSSNALTISVQGNLTLEAPQGQVQIKGMGVTVDAGTGAIDIKGMGATLDGGAGTVDVKGTLINLN